MHQQPRREGTKGKRVAGLILVSCFLVLFQVSGFQITHFAKSLVNQKRNFPESQEMFLKRFLSAATFTALLFDPNLFNRQVLAVDRSKFRTCEQTGFCRRHRREDFAPPKFEVVPGSAQTQDGTFSAKLVATQHSGAPLDLKIHFYENGIARMRVTEDMENPRWEADDVVTEGGLVPAADAAPLAPGALGRQGGGAAAVVGYGGGRFAVAVDFAPFRVSLYVDGQEQVVANSRGLMHFEQRGGSADRQRQGGADGGAGADFDRHGGKEVVDYGEDGLAIYADGTKEERRVLDDRSTQGHDGDGPETFQGHKDRKKNGPTSVGLDLAFPGFTQLYGLPEHAGPLALRTTRGAGAQYSDPYRLYNLDVFEYELDNPMALYGAVPLLMGHKVGGVGGHSTAGAFWFNPSETFVDIERTPEAMRARLISESGVVDLLLLPGPSPAAAYRQYAQLPPLFALAYHQCRWNYKDEKDVLQVDAKFEELDFPYDVIWLDIEHTDDKRYFTWNSHLFPDPARMINAVAAHGRRMVTIVDPHVKRDANYRIHKIATDKGYYVKDRDGEDFDGWCWPGASSYLDFTSEEVRSWWADQFALDTYQGSTLDLFTWNDMNEPSVFNGPEVSMSKECQSLAGVEHREWHNLYGLYFHRATAEGLRRRSPGGNMRPFVLSRSFFAGTQTAGAIWTGDNAAEWSHLAVAAPMLLQLSVGGVPFVGADVGGFFGNPEPELLIRWYQAGAFQPFFRAHAHIETKRREPWVFGEPTTSILRHAVMRRYQFLPLWYTLFFEGTFSGLPPMRPLWMEFPEDTEVLAMDDQWMVGAALLVKPVVEAGKTSVDVYLPKGVWYNELDAQKHTSSGAVKRFAAPLESLPVFLRGGAIVPKKMRLRRSSRLMAPDPYTLVVAPDEKGRADGTLFMDDEESFDYTNGAMRYMTMKFDGISLTSTVSDIKSSDTRFKPQNRIERVVILGQTAAPSSVTLLDQQEKETELTFDYDINKQALTVRKPGCLAATSWAIVISNDKSQLSS